LANFLTDQGHEVSLLIGQQATFKGDLRVHKVENFTTTKDLREHLHGLSAESVGSVFHTAAVSDFTFGKIWLRSAQGELSELKSGKISTRQGTLLAELLPTPKIIAELRGWFPRAKLVGWKFEVDGARDAVISLARKQIAECDTDASVANGPAYGGGFGLVTRNGFTHLADMHALFERLGGFLRETAASRVAAS
jgi:phosphopantothenoylcysteine decarboxylase/phosphopantothenate--cysteine ligase